jgi:hypothetical protein
MNVIELTGPEGTTIRMGTAMAYMSGFGFIFCRQSTALALWAFADPSLAAVPLSVAIIAIFVLIAFKRDVIEWAASYFTSPRPPLLLPGTAASTRSLTASSYAPSKKLVAGAMPTLSGRNSSSYGSASV